MTEIQFESGGNTIHGELYTPVAGAGGQVIVVVHGSDGMLEPWGTAIRQYASSLAEQNFTVLIPQYFGSTQTTPGMGAFGSVSNLSAWVEAVSESCRFLERSPATASPAGLLGFSLGGHICLRLRASAAALAVYFAPELRELGGIGPPGGSQRPSVQIHHGTADMVVPFEDARRIAAILTGEGNDVEVFSYESAGHGFASADAANATAARVSKGRTIAFFTHAMRTQG